MAQCPVRTLVSYSQRYEESLFSLEVEQLLNTHEGEKLIKTVKNYECNRFSS